MAFFSREIRLKVGNFLAIIGMIVSMSIAYGELKADRINIKEDVANVQGSLQDLKVSVDDNTHAIERLNELLENGTD